MTCLAAILIWLLSAAAAFAQIPGVNPLVPAGGGGGGGGGSGVSITCPAGGPFTTLNNKANIIPETGTATLSTCGAIYQFTTTGATTGNLPAPSNGFYLTGVTNVPSSTNAVTLTPASGSICSATCTSSYSLPIGSSIGIYSDGTNYFLQASPISPTINGPGYVTGLWYVEDNVVGQATGTVAESALTAYCKPTTIRNLTATTAGSGIISTVYMNITTLAASGNMQVALYTNNATNNRPGTLVSNTANISVAATGAVTGTMTASVTPGMYWFCSQADNTTVRFSISSTGTNIPQRAGMTTNTSILGNTSGAVNTTTGITAFGTWPSFVSATWSSSGNISPLIEFTFSSISP